MAGLVDLMHKMGAHELARQYEWWTLKSQPNAMKRTAYDNSPTEGHVAVDFRAGMALLPFLPQCPADFKLIFKGIGRGSLVQFDRGDTNKLQDYIKSDPETFQGMEGAIDELKKLDKDYRNSLPDITHHHVKLLYSRKLWSSILTHSIQSWKLRRMTDDKTSEKLGKNRFLAVLFYILVFIPILGFFIRRFWGRKDLRLHFWRMFTSLDYFRRASRARIAAALIRWHRAGRISEARTKKLSQHTLRFFAHMPLSILPANMHRFFSDKQYFKQSLDNIFARPLRLYFKAEVREQWLRDMISQGEKNRMLNKKEADHILSQIKEPFIQKYLKSLAVHVCTVPVTQIVSIIVAIIYVRLHPELSWQQASVHAGLILGLFQVIPISPGSLARGLYVTILVLRERNFKDYNIAFYLSFFKYIGYLAFPIQMAYRYPDLARFMAGHWATGAVHIIPVFGEHGALPEHAVFDLFYNKPLNIRRRINERKELRAGLKPRNWHIPLCVLAGTAILGVMDVVYFKLQGFVPGFKNIWWIALWIPVFASTAAALWSGGSTLARRVLKGTACGALIGLLYAALNTALAGFVWPANQELVTGSAYLSRFALSAMWRVFLFSIVATVSALVAETRPLKSKSKPIFD
jgi:hypothetical protein